MAWPWRRKTDPWRSVRRRARRRTRGDWLRADPETWMVRLFVLLLVLPPVTFRLAEIATGHTTPTVGCRVTRVVDGDTVQLSCPDTGAVRGRLLGFDTPEVFSPQCASELRDGLLAAALLRKEIWRADKVETRGRGTDRYGRRLVRLYLDDEDVAARMLASGLARAYHGGPRAGWCE